MSRKTARIATLIEGCRGAERPAHYLGYFECFNRGLFYEAHDVLEELWLPNRGGTNDAFYKGLIQFAGAFVHLQKHSARHQRLRPAAALFRLARTNLQNYPPTHEGLNLKGLLAITDQWVEELEKGGFRENPFKGDNAPRLRLIRADDTE